jgi:hypothetical protein
MRAVDVNAAHFVSQQCVSMLSQEDIESVPKYLERSQV